MTVTVENLANKFRRRYWLALVVVAVVGLTLLGSPQASANHPVYLEGNCNPFQPFVTPGRCGDFDGDGRVGTAEDADSATDRIFGTIDGALGSFPLGNAADGSGPLNPTTAGQNGRIIIVTSGRFAETISLGGAFPNPGNIQIEAAPGVEANIDAVVQGDANNTNRQNASGITVDTPATVIVTLRNLTIRNFRDGIRLLNNSRVNLENVRIDNNRDFGIVTQGNSRLTANHVHITATGYRVNPAVTNTPTPGDGLRIQNTSAVWLSHSTIFHSFRNAVFRDASASLVQTDVVLGDNGVDSVIVLTPASDITASDEP